MKTYTEQVMADYKLWEEAPGIHHQIPELVKRLEDATNLLRTISETLSLFTDSTKLSSLLKNRVKKLERPL